MSSGLVSNSESDRPYLTPRQLEVLELVAKGLTNKEIGSALSIAPGTASVHVAAVISALDVTNRTEAASRLHELGLGQTQPPEQGQFQVPGFGERPAIAVLPFRNLSNDPEHAFLADGVVEDLIAGLSSWRWFPVISRSSTLSLDGDSIDPKKASAALGARYLVEGSVRVASGRVRISVHIVDGRSGHQDWSRSFERDLTHVFETQDEIVESIVATLEPALLKIRGLHVLSRHAETLSAWESFERGFTHAWENNGKGLEQAQGFFERAIEIEPHFGAAYGGLIYCLFHQYVLGRVGNPEETVARAETLAARTLALDSSSSFAHLAVGLTKLLQKEPESAVIAFDRAIELNPSMSWAHLCRGVAQVAMGHADEARASVECAMRLSPEDPMLYLSLNILGITYTTKALFAEAAPFFERSIAMVPNAPHAYILLAGCRLAAGDLEAARALARKTREVDPDYDPRWSIRILVPPDWKEPSMAMLDALDVP